MTLTFTEALAEMHRTLRMAGYPAARIEVHVGLPDVDAAQREEEVARAIIEEALVPKMREQESVRPPYRFPRPLAIVRGVFVYTEERR